MHSPLRIVALGTDAHMLEQGSRQRARLERYALLANAYVALVFACVPAVATRTDGALTTIALPRRSLRALWYLFAKLPPYAGTTVISAQDPFEIGLIAWLLSLRYGWRLHVQVHTAIFSPAFRAESLRTRVQAAIAPFVLRRAHAIRVVAPMLRDELVARGFDASRISVIPITEDRPVRLRAHPYDGGVISVLCVARFVPVKNLEALMEAFAVFAAAHDARLTLIGGGPLEPRLRDAVQRLKLGDRVSLEAWRDDLDEAYGASDLVVLPSLYEGFGLAVVEALMRGIPVVVTPFGGAAAYVTADNGVVASGFSPRDIADALARVTAAVLKADPALIRASLRVPTPAEADALTRASWERALRA